MIDPFAVPESDPKPPSPASSRGVVVPSKPTGLQRAVGRLVYVVERVVSSTLRCNWRDHSGLNSGMKEGPVIFCLWHNRLATSMIVHRRYPRPLAALISASKDGALLAAVMSAFGVFPVRGSSSRRGPQALLELARKGASGYDLAVTPDGPRGPKYVVQKGVISLAQLTGWPIIPVTCNTSWKLCIKSWDAFQVPLPFARCDFLLSEPIVVPREASEEARENFRVRLENALRSSVID